MMNRRHFGCKLFMLEQCVAGWLACLLVMVAMATSGRAQEGPRRLDAVGDDAPLRIVASPQVDEELFLIRGLESLYGRLPISNGQFAELRREAIQHAEYAKARNLAAVIAEMYEDFATLAAAADDAIAAIQRADREAAAQADEDQSKDMMGASFKGGWVAGRAYADGASGLGAIAAGMGVGVVNYWLEHSGKETAVSEAVKARVDRIVRDYEFKCDSTVARAKSVCSTLVIKHGWGAAEVGFDATEAEGEHLERTIAQGDFREAARLCDAQRRKRPRDPFILMATAIYSAAALGETAKPEELIRHSDTCVEAASLIPEGSFYDRYRSDFLAVAATLADEAARAEDGGRGWVAAPFPSAPKAVKLWRTYLAFDQADSSGDARAQLAWALMRAGRVDDAIHTAAEVVNIKKNQIDPDFWYNAACMLCIKNELNRSLERLRQAIVSHGHHGITHAKFDPDLAKLRSQKMAEFADLTDVKFDWTIDWGVFSDDIVFTNKSEFELTGVRFSPVVTSSGYSQWSQQFIAESIPPGETIRWNTRITSRGDDARRSVGKLVTDQD